MEQFLIKLKDKKKRDFFLELMKQLEFVEVIKPSVSPQKRKLIKEMMSSFEEVRLHQTGKARLKTLDQILDDL